MPSDPAFEAEPVLVGEPTVAGEPYSESLCDRVEAYIEERPVKAMLLAALAGFFFSRIVL